MGKGNEVSRAASSARKEKDITKKKKGLTQRPQVTVTRKEHLKKRQRESERDKEHKLRLAQA